VAGLLPCAISSSPHVVPGRWIRDVRECAERGDPAVTIRVAPRLPQIAGRLDCHERCEARGCARAAARPSGTAASALAPPLAARLNRQGRAPLPRATSPGRSGAIAIRRTRQDSGREAAPVRDLLLAALCVWRSECRDLAVLRQASPCCLNFRSYGIKLSRAKDCGRSAFLGFSPRERRRYEVRSRRRSRSLQSRPREQRFSNEIDHEFVSMNGPHPLAEGGGTLCEILPQALGIT
jgi:hypothetical protein